MLSNKLYDILRWIAQLVLPGLATFYFAFAGIWNFPLRGEIVGTIVAVNMWLSAILLISNTQYRLTASAFSDEDRIDIPGSPFKMSLVTYSLLKWITIAFLPATAALYLALGKLWDFPYGEEVVGSVVALTTFMGLLLGVSKALYNKAQG